MSPVSLLCLVLCATACCVSGYNTRYDNVDLNRILGNDRLLTSYFACLVDRGRCTPDGEELKRTIPDALVTGCSKCSAKQREGSNYVTRYLISRRPDLYAELERKYDPQRVYRARYLAGRV